MVSNPGYNHGKWAITRVAHHLARLPTTCHGFGLRLLTTYAHFRVHGLEPLLGNSGLFRGSRLQLLQQISDQRHRVF